MKKSTIDKKEKNTNKKYGLYFLLIFVVIIGIAISENYLMKKFTKKPYTLYTKTESLLTEKTLKPYAYKVHGIFNSKEKVFDIKDVTKDVEQQFNTNQGETCYLSTSSVKGESVKDILSYKIYAYDEKLNHIEVLSNVDDGVLSFKVPMEIGTYTYIYEIEFENKDKLVYSFYLNVLEMIDVALVNKGNVEELAYKEVDLNQDEKLDTMQVYDKTRLSYYLSNATVTTPLDEEVVADKILYINEDKFINQINVYILEDRIVFYKEFNSTYYELASQFYDEFLKLI